MDWIRNTTISRLLKGLWGFRRLIEVVSVGAVLIVIFVIFSLLGQPSWIANVQSKNGCRFNAIYNFGDSNSDTGSVSAIFGRVPPPYGRTFFGKPSGRYSDGRLIIDFIAEKLGFPYLRSYLDSIGANFHHGANFAASGSTIQQLDAQLCTAGFNPITLDVQILQFEQLKARTFESYAQARSSDIKILPNPESFSRALFTMDSGQNDLHAGLTSVTVEQVKASVPRIIKQFSGALEKLYKLGARAFWIHNTGPIGCLPFFAANYSSKPSSIDSFGCIKSYNEVAREFNNQLKEQISLLQSQYRDAMLVYVDIYSVKYSLIGQGINNGFFNPFGYCCGRLGMIDCGEKKKNANGTELIGDSCSNPMEYISWDSVHYSEAANKWVATHILNGSFSQPQVSIAEACYNPS